MRLSVGPLIQVGFNLHIKRAKIRDKIQPEIQTSKSEGVVPAWVSFSTWIQPWMKDSGQLFLLQQSQHSEGGKDDIMFTNNIKSKKVRSLFGLHSPMWCYLNTKIRLSHLRCLKVTCIKVACPANVGGLGSLSSPWREVGVSRWLGEASSFGSTFEDVVCTTCREEKLTFETTNSESHVAASCETCCVLSQVLFTPAFSLVS